MEKFNEQIKEKGLEQEIKELAKTSANEAANEVVEEIYPEASEEQKSKVLDVIKEKLPSILIEIIKVMEPFEAKDDSIKEHAKSEIKNALYAMSVVGVVMASSFGIGPAPEGSPGRERINKLIDRVKNW